MDLYCDCTECVTYRNNYRGDGGTHAFTIRGFTQFGGKNFSDCLKQAKGIGWVFKNGNETCYAPGHKE